MSLIDRQLGDVWDALRANGRDRDDALPEVRIRKLRGIWDLRVPFEYPVSVLADEGKAAVGALAPDLDRTVPDVARIVGQREAEANALPELTAALTEQINAWRRL